LRASGCAATPGRRAVVGVPPRPDDALWWVCRHGDWWVCRHAVHAYFGGCAATVVFLVLASIGQKPCSPPCDEWHCSGTVPNTKSLRHILLSSLSVSTKPS